MGFLDRFKTLILLEGQRSAQYFPTERGSADQ
jgi:hypothetical protein